MLGGGRGCCRNGTSHAPLLSASGRLGCVDGAEDARVWCVGLEIPHRPASAPRSAWLLLPAPACARPLTRSPAPPCVCLLIARPRLCQADRRPDLRAEIGIQARRRQASCLDLPIISITIATPPSHPPPLLYTYHTHQSIPCPSSLAPYDPSPQGQHWQHQHRHRQPPLPGLPCCTPLPPPLPRLLLRPSSPLLGLGSWLLLRPRACLVVSTTFELSPRCSAGRGERRQGTGRKPALCSWR